MNSVNTDINIFLNREENHLNIHDSYLVIEFDKTKNDGIKLEYVGDIRLVIYGMLALFSLLKIEAIGGRTIQ